MQLHISEPVVVAMGPDSRTTGWGVYQFPDIFRLPDGRLMCAFADSGDTIDAYGAERGCCVSSDGGATWERARERDFDSVVGIPLDNGDRVQFIELSSIPITAEMQFPEPAGSNGSTVLYRADELDESICNKNWIIHRVSAEHPEGVMEPAIVKNPDLLVRTGDGIVVPVQPWGRLRKDADGALWMPDYSYGYGDDGKFSTYLNNYLYRSTDNGKTWDLMHMLNFDLDGERKPGSSKPEGFNENCICFTPDGSYVRLIRTGSRKCPLYIVRSEDKGVTWSEPELFDDRGVWPQMVSLKCGVTLATYGRPGFFLRATEDPSCKVWNDRITLIEDPEEIVPIDKLSTCSYSDLIALDDHTAGLVYTDFRVKDDQGIPHKTIMFCKISVEP